MLRIIELKLPLQHTQAELSAAITQRLGITEDQLLSYTIFRQGHDARRRDALDAEAEGGEEQREDAPAHAVVEVVDQPTLRQAEKGFVLPAHPPEYRPEGELFTCLMMLSGFLKGITALLPDEKYRQEQPADGKDDAHPEQYQSKRRHEIISQVCA